MPQLCCDWNKVYAHKVTADAKYLLVNLSEGANAQALMNLHMLDAQGYILTLYLSISICE